MAKKKEVERSIIAADLHIQKKPGMWAGRAEIAGDDIFALEQIARIADEKGAKLYLLGDVLDSVTNLPRPIVSLQNALGTLAKMGKVFFIQGQHELVVQAHYENAPWLSLLPGAVHLASEEFSANGFSFHGLRAYALDYFPQAFEGLALSKVPKDVQVLFMHGTIDTAFPTAYHFSADSLKKFPDLMMVFAGDYHQAIEVQAGSVPVYYTGSTWQIAANEPREKSVIMVEQDGTKLEISRIPLLTRRIVKLSECYDSDGNFDINTVALRYLNDDLLPKELQTPVILIDMPTGGAMLEQLAEHGHLYHTSASNPNLPTQAVIDEVNKLTNREILSHFVDQEKHPSEFDFTLDVIENPANDAIQRLKDKLGIKTEDRVVAAAQTTEINLEADNVEEEEEILA